MTMTAKEHRSALARCRAGSASDSDRIALATRQGDMMIGPTELQRCSIHPRNTEAYRWVWPVGATPEDSDGEFVRGCVKCAEIVEEDEEY